MKTLRYRLLNCSIFLNLKIIITSKIFICCYHYLHLTMNKVILYQLTKLQNKSLMSITNHDSKDVIIYTYTGCMNSS